MMEVKSNFKMTDIGKLPFDWEVKKIEDITNILDSRRKPLNKEEREKRKGIIPYFGANGKVDSIDDYIFDQPLILLAEDGGYFDEYEHRPIAYKVEGKSWVNNHAHVLEPKKSESFNWIYYSLVHKNILSYINSGTRAKLNQADLRRIKIAFPPLKEQQKIAEILSTVDEQIEQTDQLIEKTKELKKGLMQQLLTKGIGHTEFKQTELGEIPVDWEFLMYEEVLELIDGDRSKKYPSGNDIVKQGILFLSTGDIKDDKLDYSHCRFITEEKFKSLSKGKLTSGDIIITLRGTLGSVALFQGDRFNTGFINAQMMILRPHKRLDSHFFYYFMISSQFKKQLKAITSGSAQPQLTKKDLKKVKLTLPTKEEQKEIASILTSVDEDILGYRQEKEKYEELKKGLMQQLLTGKTRVKID